MPPGFDPYFNYPTHFGSLHEIKVPVSSLAAPGDCNSTEYFIPPSMFGREFTEEYKDVCQVTLYYSSG